MSSKKKNKYSRIKKKKKTLFLFCFTCQAEQLVPLRRDQPRHRDARPLGDDLRDVAFGDHLVHEAARRTFPSFAVASLGVARGGGLLEGGLGLLELPVELEQRAVLELGCVSILLFFKGRE